MPLDRAGAARGAGAGRRSGARRAGDAAGVVEAVGRLAAWDFTTPTGIPEGYDAADVDGVLGGPTCEEVVDERRRDDLLGVARPVHPRR